MMEDQWTEGKVFSISSMCILSFVAGIFVGLIIFVVMSAPRDLHKEAKLPEKCTVAGEQVLVTTPVPSEFYICEATYNWKRR